MKIVVTGGSGFLGSHVSDALSAAGHDVVIFDTATSKFLRPNQTEVVGSILDFEAVSRSVRGCDVVYHLAAMADIDEALDNPRTSIEINIIGTLNVLEAVRAHQVKRLVFSSSIYVFSDQGSFYRTTKKACEDLIDDYRLRFGTEFTILRFGSLYGPRADRKNGMFRLLSQALTERRIDYYGTGEEVREYINVMDAAAMSVEILAPEFVNQYLHLTGRERITSRDMLQMVNEIMGGRIEIRFGETSPTGHYLQTPYNYTPKIGRRLTQKTYIDLGLGILDCLQQIEGSAGTANDPRAERK